MTDRLWAKRWDSKGSPPEHVVLPGHLCDVYESAKRVLDLTDKDQLAALGLNPGDYRDRLRRVVLFAAAMHDLGKANDHFQGMITGRRDVRVEPQGLRHEWATLLMMWSHRDWLLPTVGSDLDFAIAEWAIAGHHPAPDHECPPKNGRDGSGTEIVLLMGHPDYLASLYKIRSWFRLSEPVSCVDVRRSLIGNGSVFDDRCPSKTYPQSSQEVSSNTPGEAVLPEGPLGPGEATFAIDWLETRGCIEWNESSSEEQFWRLDELQKAAKEAKSPVVVTLGPMTGLLHGHGIGSGQQVHLEYRFEYRGVMFALSARRNASRTLSNFYLKISGEPSLIEGALEAREVVLEVVKSLGGVVIDEWVQRIDICLDLPGVNLNDELQPAFDRGQFLTQAKKWNPFDGTNGKTGFNIGSRQRLKCIVYEKVVDVIANHSPVYLQAMIDRRWNGCMPEFATRVEYQITKHWLGDKVGLRTADDVLGRLGDIVARIVAHDCRAFFCLTSSKPDRKNKHQSRVEVLRLWDRITKAFVARAGEPRVPLQPIRRGMINAKRAYQLVRGVLVTVGAGWDRAVLCLEDAIEVLKDLDRLNNGTSEDWELRWDKKALRAGTYNKVTGFEFGDNKRSDGQAI